MADTISAAETLIGIGLETTPGKPVKVTHIFDTTEHNFDTQLARATSEARRASPSEFVSETIAASVLSGSLTAVAKGDGAFFRLLETYYGEPATTPVSAGSLPATTTTAGITAGTNSFPVADAAGFFDGATITIDAGGTPETKIVRNVYGNTIIVSTPLATHASGVAVARTAPPAAGSHFLHRLNHKFTEVTATLVIIEGPYAFVYAGIHGNTLGIGAAKDQTSTVTAACGLMALNFFCKELLTDEDRAELGFDGSVGSSLLEDYGPVEPAVLYNNERDTDAKRFKFEMDRQLSPGHTWNGYVGPKRFNKSKSRVSGSQLVEFTDLRYYLNYWGQEGNAALPVSLGSTVKYGDVRYQLDTPMNASHYRNTLQIVMPEASIQSLPISAGTDGPIELDIPVRPKHSNAEGVNHYLTVRNQESHEQITTRGEDLVSVPPSVLFPTPA